MSAYRVASSQLRRTGMSDTVTHHTELIVNFADQAEF